MSENKLSVFFSRAGKICAKLRGIVTACQTWHNPRTSERFLWPTTFQQFAALFLSHSARHRPSFWSEPRQMKMQFSFSPEKKRRRRGREDNERDGMIYACHLKQFRTLLSSRPLGTSFQKQFAFVYARRLRGSIDNLNEQRLCKSNYAVERPARRRVRMIQCHCTEGAWIIRN